MKLSERIAQMRIDRPDEWQMDELMKWAQSLEALVKEAYEEGFEGGLGYAWDHACPHNPAPDREDGWDESRSKKNIRVNYWDRKA